MFIFVKVKFFHKIITAYNILIINRMGESGKENRKYFFLYPEKCP